MRFIISKIITFESLDKILSQLTIFPNNPKIAVAVSGGRDSLCLAFLLKKWVSYKNGSLTAIIVDHKLRDNSTEEATFVKNVLKEENINSLILTREDVKLHSKIQSQAREDRYTLIKDYCKNNDIAYLMVGHHLDDQLETMVMRKEKGESIIGNSGMSAKVVDEKVILLRPLLNFSRLQITNTMLFLKKSWVEDPSNNNIKYKRVFIRKKIQKINFIIRKMLLWKLNFNQRSRIKIEQDFVNFFIKSVKMNQLGLTKINLSLFNEYSSKLQLFGLRKILKFVAGNNYSAKIKKTEKFLEWLRQAQKLNNYNKKYTLGGCNCSLIRQNNMVFLLISRELKKLPNIIAYSKYNNDLLWDNRFIITAKKEGILKAIKDSDIKNILNDDKRNNYLLNTMIRKENLKTLVGLFVNDEIFLLDNKPYLPIELKIKDSLLANVFVFVR